MPIQYLVIGIHKFVDASNWLDVNFIDVNNVFQRFVNVNEIANKLVIDIDKLVHANIVIDVNKFVDINILRVIFLPCQGLCLSLLDCQK